jgi:glycosyltransferase involved in cell wall biosynthesis
LEESIYANARRIFTRSTNITRSLARDYGCPPEKTKCVYVGVNVKGKEYTAKEVSKEGQNILFVGIDWERKGGPELVEAFKEVLAVHPQAQLTIIGCNPEINLPNCLVLGRLPLDELQRYYASASIFCLPTKLEPFGVVFVEAMANGLPIVATDIGAIPDFVQEGENGYLVAPGQVDELAEALIDLLGNPEKRRRFGMRSLALATERYNWKSVGQTIRECILADLEQLPVPLPGHERLKTGVES